MDYNPNYFISTLVPVKVSKKNEIAENESKKVAREGQVAFIT